MNAHPLNQRPVMLPSWLLSVALHLTLLVVLGLLIRTPQTMGLTEPDRAVGIALAQHDVDSTEYFDETDGVDQDSASTQREPSASDESVELPDTAPDFPLSNTELSLPSAPALPVPTDAVFSRPELAGGGKVRLRPSDGVAEILDEESKRKSRNVPSGPPGHVSVFGSAVAEGHSFIFVIDRSNSMGSGGLGALSVASREFQRALVSLGSAQTFQILAYNHERVFFEEEPFVPATEANKNRIGTFMRGIAAFGGTDHYLGLSSALYRQPDVIFLLTDGGDPELSAGQMVKIRRRAARRTTIHCIQFGARPWQGDDHFMQRLAKENGGSFRYVDLSNYPRG